MSQPDPLIGSVIAGRYEIVREIGRGGMGTIYEVRNTRLGRSFALKMLTGGAEGEVLARFRREAEIVAKLRHPNILEVVDWDVLEDGSPCMIMEYLVGEDLSQRLAKRGALTWPDLARIADQVLAALSVAHRAGVVHRDLKPQNIFIATDDGDDERVKLLDFGISKLHDARALTTTETKVMGTPSYMPPEQAEGRQEDIGPATDVWAMGTILYEMATATVAFNAPSIPAVLYRVCHGRPRPLIELRPDAPPEFIDVIDRALTREIDQRPHDVDQLRRELRAAFGALEGIGWSEPLRARTRPIVPVRITPAAGTPAIGPIATAPTMGVILEGVATERTQSEAPASERRAAAPALAAIPRARSRWPIAAALGGLVVAGAIVVVVKGVTRGRAATPGPALVTSPQLAIPAPTPAPVPAAVLARVEVTIQSKPEGADIYRLPSEVKVGATPWTTELGRADGTAVFVLKKAGWVDRRVEVQLSAGGTTSVELERVAVHTVGVHPPAGLKAPSPASTDPTTPQAPVKPPAVDRKKGEPVDPFAKGKSS